jgi:hypothetical protein
LHAQTNLQLYRQLIQASWDESSLMMIRRGYELALQLFADAYRASRRPFVAHLVGTASALESWRQRPVVVAAGLLHSAYLLGHFGDGPSGITPARRRILTKEIGAEAEQLVHDYTLTKNEEQLAAWCASSDLSPGERDLATLQLANLYDDCRDGEPCFASAKKRALELPWGVAGRQAVLRLAERAAGPVAVDSLSERFRELDEIELPPCLVNESRPKRRIAAGVAELARPTIGGFLWRAFPFLQKKLAA